MIPIASKSFCVGDPATAELETAPAPATFTGPALTVACLADVVGDRTTVCTKVGCAAITPGAVVSSDVTAGTDPTLNKVLLGKGVDEASTGRSLSKIIFQAIHTII